MYIDDILVMGHHDEEHLRILEQVLARLQEYGLHLKKEKCSFIKPSVEYLGHIVDKDGLRAIPANMETITNAPEPSNVNELHVVCPLVSPRGLPGEGLPHPACSLPWLPREGCQGKACPVLHVVCPLITPRGVWSNMQCRPHT